jgi:hypothetical protein
MRLVDHPIQTYNATGSLADPVHARCYKSLWSMMLICRPSATDLTLLQLPCSIRAIGGIHWAYRKQERHLQHVSSVTFRLPTYYHAVALTCKPRAGSDLVMSSDRWTTSVVGKLSPWLDLDSDCIATRSASERAFKQEIAWASHLGGKQSVACEKSGTFAVLPEALMQFRPS